jgi:uncharacterized protein (TIGR02996 family)
MDEEVFITAIRNAPRDDATRLVYADWLDEQGDVRGEWLRVGVRLRQLLWHDAREPMAAKLRWLREVVAHKRRLRELRPFIPEAWALRVEHGYIEYCHGVGCRDRCPRDWLRLRESEEPARRSCGHCQRWVRYCWSASDAHAALAAGQPVVKALAMDRDGRKDIIALPAG